MRLDAIRRRFRAARWAACALKDGLPIEATATLFDRLNRDVGQLDPMVDAAFPSRDYC